MAPATNTLTAVIFRDGLLAGVLLAAVPVPMPRVSGRTRSSFFIVIQPIQIHPRNRSVLYRRKLSRRSGRAGSFGAMLFGTLLAIHIVVIALAAAGLLTAAAFALALILLTGLTSLATLVLLTRLVLTRRLVSALLTALLTALLRVLRLLSTVRHLDTPQLGIAEPTVEPPAAQQM
jgi:hypothetical protein